MRRDFWAENLPAFLFAHKIARRPYVTSYGPDVQDLEVTSDEGSSGFPVNLTATAVDHRYPGDPVRPITAAEYFIGAPGQDGAGIPLDPMDGAWGGLSEVVAATIETGSLSLGRHVLLVHGQNDLGDWGPFTAVFVEVEVCDVYLPAILRG
jgi:hypothetical protein